jgi:hypothetical protein
MLFGLKHRLWKFIDDGKELPIDDRSVTDLSRVSQFACEYSSGRRVSLRRNRNYESFGPGNKAARGFSQHRVRICFAAEFPKLIDQNEGGLLPDDGRAVGGDDFQDCLCL